MFFIESILNISNLVLKEGVQTVYRHWTTDVCYHSLRLSKTTCTLFHCGLVTPYGDVDMGQRWNGQWSVAWQHQAMTWTNVDLSSVRSTNIHLRVISHDIPQQSVTKIIYLKFHSNLQAKDFPDGPHVGPTNLALRVSSCACDDLKLLYTCTCVYLAIILH